MLFHVIPLTTLKNTEGMVWLQESFHQAHAILYLVYCELFTGIIVQLYRSCVPGGSVLKKGWIYRGTNKHKIIRGKFFHFLMSLKEENWAGNLLQDLFGRLGERGNLRILRN